MNRTKIEWVINPDGSRGFTWNPVTGCLGPEGTPEKPMRCPYCYAHRLANGRLRKLYLSNPNVVPGCDPDDPFSPRFWPKRLNDPLKRKKPTRIFVVDMGDLFHPTVPENWMRQVIASTPAAAHHKFLYLTKRPEGYTGGWFDCKQSNEWFGITVTNQRDWDDRWPILAAVAAEVRFVSFEPLLEPVDMGHGPLPDWIIIGAQTRPTKLPNKWYVASLLNQARYAGIPIFVKDNLHTGYSDIPAIQEWPKT